MDNNLLLSTCNLPVCLQRENSMFEGGLCLSTMFFEELKDKSSLFLHPKEEKYFASLRYPKRQEDYLLGRYCAKNAIVTCSDNIKPYTIFIENGVFRQPIVYCSSHNNIQVSISHTDGIGAAIAFPESHPMAIDIEKICKNRISTIQSQMTSEEQKLFTCLPTTEESSITLLWTVKESLSKILRCGFMVPFELLEVKNVVLQDNYIISYFKNFHQYQGLSFQLSGNICSIVYPRNTQLNFDILRLQTTIMPGGLGL